MYKSICKRCNKEKRIWARNLCQSCDIIENPAKYKIEKKATTKKRKTETFAHVVLPSFVQHEGYDKSTYKIPAKVGKRLRNSANYDENFDPSVIDWKHEFSNPYIDARKRTKKTGT